MEYRRNSKPMTADERIEASKQSASVRQALMETMLVPYPQFRDGIKFIRKFHVPVEGGNPSAGRIGGLLGESRVGKTVICNYFVSQNPPSYDDEGESYPVVYVQASDEMKLPSLADRICIATGARSLTVKHKCDTGRGAFSPPPFPNSSPFDFRRARKRFARGLRSL